MMNYVVLLGNTPPLSYAELEALVSAKAQLINSHLALITLDNDEQVYDLQEKLGGVFKILQIVKQLSAVLTEAHQEIANYLSEETKEKSSRVSFSINSVGKLPYQIDARQIKPLLIDEGLSARYVESSEWGLNSIELKKRARLCDLFVVQIEGEVYLLKTVTVSDANQWIKRDRDKPYFSGKKGMLPPKLARIMVNLGLGQLIARDASSNPVLYDPFCGSGTILLEAVLRGCQVIGSDIDTDAVADTQQNLKWLEAQSQQSYEYSVFQADVVTAASKIENQKIDLIVTEPFLGKPNPVESELDNIYIGLKGLYLGAFKAWIKILRKGSIVVIVFPYVQTSSGQHDLFGLIDKFKRFGYTLVINPLDYHREKAEVKRQILVFRYQ